MQKSELEAEVRKYLRKKYPQVGVGKVSSSGKSWKWHCWSRRICFEIGVTNTDGQLAKIDLYCCPKCGDITEGDLSGWARRVIGLPKSK